MQYSRKCWWKLNLTVDPKIAHYNIGGFKFGVSVQHAVLIWLMQRLSKPLILILHQIFSATLYTGPLKTQKKIMVVGM